MQKASLKIMALAAIMTVGVSSGARAAITLDTTGSQQVFGINGTSVGTWTTSLFQVTTPLAVTGLITGNNITSNGTITAASMTSGAYYHSSDARLKTDIHPINGALDKVLALHGVEFNWKKDGRADMGVVAQNVAQVFPNIVTKNESGVMAVEYDSLVGPMIEAIRDLKAQNDDLRAQVKEIRVSMQTLKQENTRLHSVKADSNAVQQPVTLNP